MKRLLHWPGDDPAGKTLGGKALGLQRLAAAGSPVPPWCVFPAEAAAGPWREDPAVIAELSEAFATLAAQGDGAVAVRSSAALEDGATHSFAGVFETRFADHPGGLFPALMQVLGSNTAPAARAYGARQEDGDGPMPMAVVLQTCIHAEYAGVLFSADPAAADPRRLYLEAVIGVGSGLADGQRTPTRIWIDSEQHTAVSTVPGADGPEAIPPALLGMLARELIRLERIFDAPIDMEWCVDAAGRAWLLQARPISVLRADPALCPAECMTSWFFDQRFSGPIHPLTQTRLLPTIAQVALGDALRLRGAPVPDQLLTYYAGQAYVPHAIWRSMLRGAPRRFLSADLRQLFPAHCACTARETTLVDMIHYAGTSLCAVWRERADVLLNLRAWRLFEMALNEGLKSEPDPGDCFPEATWATLKALTQRFLQIHRWSILWADYAYRVFRLSLWLLPRRGRTAFERALHQSLHLVTAEANAALAQVLAHPTDLARRDAFIAQYGHRSGSLDWAVPTWGELLRAWRLDELASIPAQLPPHEDSAAPAALWICRALYPLRRLLELREAQRFAWERILARQRACILDTAAQLQQRGLLAEIDDVWFLTWDAFTAAATQGAPVDPVALEQRRHAHLVNTRLPRPLFLGPHPIVAAPAGLTLQGLGASSGTVRGVAVVIAPHMPLPRRLADDQIAVLVALDPAWTALMAQARGLVIERGGLLSHAAILAREYRVPLVIGVDHATAHLRTGDPIEINGDTGTVTKLGG